MNQCCSVFCYQINPCCTSSSEHVPQSLLLSTCSSTLAPRPVRLSPAPRPSLLRSSPLCFSVLSPQSWLLRPCCFAPHPFASRSCLPSRGSSDLAPQRLLLDPCSLVRTPQSLLLGSCSAVLAPQSIVVSPCSSVVAHQSLLPLSLHSLAPALQGLPFVSCSSSVRCPSILAPRSLLVSALAVRTRDKYELGRARGPERDNIAISRPIFGV